MGGLGRRHPTAEKQHLHGHVIGQAPGDALNGAGVGDDAERQLGQGEGGMFGGDDQVAGDRQFHSAADGEPVDRRDHRLVEVPALGQPGEAAGSVLVLPPFVEPGVAAVDRLEVPAGREDPLARPGHDADAQLRVVAQLVDGLAQQPAGRVVDGVDLGPVQRDLENRPAPYDLHLFRHGSRLPLSSPAFVSGRAGPADTRRPVALAA